MATAAKVLSIAENEIGYYAPDDPEPGSKYGRWLAKLFNESWLAGPSKDVWWCCIFVSWCLDQAGVEVPGFPSYNTDVSWSKAKVLGVNKYDAKPGDIVIFDWNMGTPATDHIGFVEKRTDDWTIQTIEGNTSGTDWGSQYAGNGVHRRSRSLDVVRYCIRPEYDDNVTEEPSTNSERITFIPANVTFTVKETMNVRPQPALSSDVVTKLAKGTRWSFDGVVFKNGYVWGTYIGPTTKKRLYIALGTTEFIK